MPPSTVSLTTDDIDDLIYFSRAGELDSLKESIDSLATTHACSAYSIVTRAIDTDEEGLGSGSCLLHYPAANGNLEIVTYLLSLINGDQPSASIANGASASPKPASSESLNYINHQNVSGNTALHWAGLNGHLQIVQALIKAGADPEIVNSAGRDAVVESEYSPKDGAAECAVWILKECGALEKGVGEVPEEGESSERLAEDGDEQVEEDNAEESTTSNAQSSMGSNGQSST